MDEPNHRTEFLLGGSIAPLRSTGADNKKMVAKGGIEPPTRGFSIPCSTN